MGLSVVRQITVVISMLCIHLHLVPWGVATRGVLGVSPEPWREIVRLVATRIESSIWWPLRPWNMALPLNPLLFSVKMSEKN